MKLRRIDLNLLVIFDALMAERSVSRAAERVGISQSAMSHALARLRRTFNDDIITRTPRGMVPTRRAELLIEPIRSALRQIDETIDEQVEFDQKTSRRTFRIRLSDYLVGCLMPQLCARLRLEAPEVTARFDHLPLRLDEEFEDPGDLQLRVCSDQSPSPDREQRRLQTDRFVVMMRRSHPMAAGKLSLDDFLALPHIRVSSAITGSAKIDTMLEQQNLRRRVVMTIPSLSGIIRIVLASDLCAILPESWIGYYIDPAMLALHPVPLPSLVYTVDMVWRRRDERDAGNRWLRTIIEDEFAKMCVVGTPKWISAEAGKDQNG